MLLAGAATAIGHTPRLLQRSTPEGGAMYATVRIYRDVLADAVARHRGEIVGLFRQIDGFRSYGMVTTGPVGATSITVCDDRPGAEASNRVARDDIAGKLTDLSVGAPEVHVGEVTMRPAEEAATA